MPIQMSYTSSYGTTYPNSYWTVGVLNVYPLKGQMQIIFHGFQDSNSTAMQPIGSKSYVVTPLDFATWFLPLVNGTPQSNLSTITYNYVAQVLDTNGKSFFDGGVRVP